MWRTLAERRGWDSNPRLACTNYGFQDRPNRPLWHPSRSGRRPSRRRVGSLADFVDDLAGDVDRDVDGHGDGDGVARPRVHLDQLAVVADPELGVVGVVAKLADVDVLQLAAEQLDRVSQQVVRQRSGGGQALDPAIDARRLEDADDDRERPLAVHLLEEDDLLLVVLVDDDPR